MRAQRSRKNVYLSRLNFPRCLQRQGGFIKVLMILGGRPAATYDADATRHPNTSTLHLSLSLVLYLAPDLAFSLLAHNISGIKNICKEIWKFNICLDQSKPTYSIPTVRTRVQPGLTPNYNSDVDPLVCSPFSSGKGGTRRNVRRGRHRNSKLSFQFCHHFERKEEARAAKSRERGGKTAAAVHSVGVEWGVVE